MYTVTEQALQRTVEVYLSVSVLARFFLIEEKYTTRITQIPHLVLCADYFAYLNAFMRI